MSAGTILRIISPESGGLDSEAAVFWTGFRTFFDGLLRLHAKTVASKLTAEAHLSWWLWPTVQINLRLFKTCI